MLGFNPTVVLPQNFQVNWNSSLCSLWLRADLGITLSGSEPTAWHDITANANNATLTSTLADATYTAATPTFNAFITLTPNSGDTAGAYFVITSSASLQPGTGAIHQWAVIKTPATWPTVHADHTIFHKATGQDSSPTDGWVMAYATGSGSGNGNVYGAIINTPVSDSLTLALSTVYLVEVMYIPGTLSTWVNGTQTASTSITTISANNALQLAIGTDLAVAPARAFAGEIFECGINIGTLSAAAHANLQAYVRARYIAW